MLSMRALSIARVASRISAMYWLLAMLTACLVHSSLSKWLKAFVISSGSGMSSD